MILSNGDMEKKGKHVKQKWKNPMFVCNVGPVSTHG